eukprot:g8203.t1
MAGKYTCNADATRHSRIASVEDCQTLCDATVGCKFILWSYKYSGYCYTARHCATSGTDRNCNLAQFMATDGPLAPAVRSPLPPPPLSSDVTVPKAIERRVYTKERCAYMAGKYTCNADATRHSRIASVEDCQTLCDATVGCKFILWSYKYSGYCYTARHCATSGTDRNCNLAQFMATDGPLAPAVRSPLPPPPLSSDVTVPKAISEEAKMHKVKLFRYYKNNHLDKDHKYCGERAFQRLVSRSWGLNPPFVEACQRPVFTRFCNSCKDDMTCAINMGWKMAKMSRSELYRFSKLIDEDPARYDVGTMSILDEMDDGEDVSELDEMDNGDDVSELDEMEDGDDVSELDEMEDDNDNVELAPFFRGVNRRLYSGRGYFHE